MLEPTDPKDQRDQMELLDTKDPKELMETQDPQDQKDQQDLKDQQDHKDLKAQKDQWDLNHPLAQLTHIMITQTTNMMMVTRCHLRPKLLIE